MNVLVTGGAGFLGRHLVSRLLADDHTVRILDIVDSHWRHPEVEFISSSFADDAILNSAVAGCDVVFHLASSVIPKTSNDDPILDTETNLVGTLRLLNACVRAGVRRVVFASSGGTIYGEPKIDPVAEDHPTDPICSYGIVKLAIEKYLALYHLLHGLESVSLRISNLYGEFQRPNTGLGAIAAFCYKAVNDKELEIWGDGTVSRDFIYVGDVVDAMCAAMERGKGHHVVNIGSGVSVSLNEIVATIQAILGRDVRKRHLVARAFDVHRTCLDIRLAGEQLDWKPRTSLKNGIGRVLQVMKVG